MCDGLQGKEGENVVLQVQLKVENKTRKHGKAQDRIWDTVELDQEVKEWEENHDAQELKDKVKDVHSWQREKENAGAEL